MPTTYYESMITTFSLCANCTSHSRIAAFSQYPAVDHLTRHGLNARRYDLARTRQRQQHDLSLAFENRDPCRRFMNDPHKRVRERNIVDGDGSGLTVTIYPRSTTLNRHTQFTIAVDGKGVSGSIASQRKAERTFSATAAMRFIRDKLNRATATFHLHPPTKGEGDGR